jgi:hypothetical protein
VLHGLPGRQQEAEDVEVEMLVKVVFGDLVERGELVRPGVVDEDIEPAERPLRFGKEALDIRALRHVALHGDRAAPRAAISATTRSASCLLEE